MNARSDVSGPRLQWAMIETLQTSADLLASRVTAIHAVAAEHDFIVLRAPSAPDNGFDPFASPFVTTPLAGSLCFGFPGAVIAAGTFRTATALIAGQLMVAAGSRCGIRLRTHRTTDRSAAAITP